MYSNDGAVATVTGMRLVNGPSSSSGRLEMKLQGQWGTVCDDGYDDTNAAVVCRLLGFSGGLYKAKSYFGIGTGPIWMTDVDCSGNERSLLSCLWSPVKFPWSLCDHSEDVSVVCRQGNLL